MLSYINIILHFHNQLSFCGIGVTCGSYGKAVSCGTCPIIYPKDSCFGDCGWILNKTTQEYECINRGNYNLYV